MRLHRWGELPGAEKQAAIELEVRRIVVLPAGATSASIRAGGRSAEQTLRELPSSGLRGVVASQLLGVLAQEPLAGFIRESTVEGQLEL